MTHAILLYVSYISFHVGFVGFRFGNFLCAVRKLGDYDPKQVALVQPFVIHFFPSGFAAAWATSQATANYSSNLMTIASPILHKKATIGLGLPPPLPTNSESFQALK